MGEQNAEPLTASFASGGLNGFVRKFLLYLKCRLRFKIGAKIPPERKAGRTLVAIRPTHRRTTTFKKIWTQEKERLTIFLTETEF